MRKKNKYLYQLIITGAILIILPTIFFFAFFLERSYQEINTVNTEYYEDMCRVFAGTFSEEVSTFKSQIMSFALSMDYYECDAIYEGTLKMSENPYYCWKALKELTEYNKTAGDMSIGIYYYDADFVLYNGVKYSVKKMIENGLKAGTANEENYRRVERFFSADEFMKSKIIFAPVYDDDGGYQESLVGVCTLLGKEKEKALCFYRVKPKDLILFYQSVQGRNWEKYYVLDSETGELLYGIGELDGETDYEEIAAASMQDETDEASMQKKFSLQNQKYNLIFVLDVSGDVEQNNVYVFYKDMRNYMIYILFLMVVVAILAVWLNYRPVNLLLKKIEMDGKDEFDIIFNSWEQQNLRLTEQRALIMDFLMNHLLYGLPLSDEQIGQLGVSEEIKEYCVFLIENRVLLSDEMAYITKTIENEFQTLLFATDLQGEESTVLVAFMQYDEAERIYEWLVTWCAANMKGSYTVYRGRTVTQLDSVRTSLSDCKEQSKAEENSIVPENRDVEVTEEAALEERHEAKKCTENYELLKTDILAYLEANFGDKELTQTKVADHFCISVYSLSRVFKKQFGMGFSEYVNVRRLEHAKLLLKTTDVSIKEVSAISGFSDANYFARIFKHNMGISPTKFRNENRQQKE